ncbi:MAG: dihydrofolate reductase family protein [Actinomycetota bacterium]|nr:dihydrofolate reductase family protein [Actinomycetota bacterium]
MALALATLWERDGLPAYPLPAALSVAYGGTCGFRSPTLYANFVTSLDGVVAAEDAPPSAISGGAEADRLVMGLLRACAEAVVVGAGTLRAEPRHLWTPEHIYPGLAGAYAELRASLGLSPTPRLVLLTGSGDVDPSLPAFELGALVLTTSAGAAALRGKLPKASTVTTLPGPRIGPAGVMAALRQEGFQVVLTEGGPTVLAQFLAAEFLDELFLTLSPRLAGRDEESHRLGLVEGHAFDPGALPAAALQSVKRHQSHLFLRYRLDRRSPAH